MDEPSSTEKQLFLSKLMTDKDIISKFLRLETYKQHFKFALKLVVQYSDDLFDSTCKKKLSEHSVRLRENGNESFVTGSYYEAIKQYTSSIVYAVDSSEELALAFANRSAALYELKKYKDCVSDINRALNLSYPDKLKSKVYKRKGLCLAALGSPDVDSAFQEALIWLDKAVLSNDEKNEIENQLKTLISTPRAAFPEPQVNVNQHPMPKISTPNVEIPCASDAIAVEHSATLGRHLVATRKIRPGELLILEKPHCAILDHCCIYTHCSHCLQISWALIPCKHCIHAAYCSERCRNEAWNEYHEIECSIVGFLLCFSTTQEYWLALRLTIITSQKGTKLAALKEEVAHVTHFKGPHTKENCDNRKFCNDQYLNIYSLPNNVDFPSDFSFVLQQLARALLCALSICLIGRETEMFGRKMELNNMFTKNPEVIFVGKLMLRNVDITLTKAIVSGASYRSASSDHGIALLAVCGLANYTCDPNTVEQWYADHFGLYAAYPIEKGEQIFKCFVPRYVEMDGSEIRGRLQNRNSMCECPFCKEDWPTLINHCSYKQKAVTQEGKTKIDDFLRQYLVTHGDFLRKDITQNIPNIITEVIKMIEVLHTHVQKPCTELDMAVVMLKDLYAAADIAYDYVPVDPPGITNQCLAFHAWIQRVLSSN